MINRIPPKGMRINPNNKIVKAINNRLEITEGFCPCVHNSIGNYEYACPCKKAREENLCCCKLFIKNE